MFISHDDNHYTTGTSSNLPVCKQMRLGSYKDIYQNIIRLKSFIFNIYCKMDLALNNLYGLTCHTIKLTNKPTNLIVSLPYIYLSIYILYIYRYIYQSNSNEGSHQGETDVLDYDIAVIEFELRSFSSFYFGQISLGKMRHRLSPQL